MYASMGGVPSIEKPSQIAAEHAMSLQSRSTMPSPAPSMRSSVTHATTPDISTIANT